MTTQRGHRKQSLTHVPWWWQGQSKGRQPLLGQNPTAMQLPPIAIATHFRPIQIHSVSSTWDTRATRATINSSHNRNQQHTAVQPNPQLCLSCSPAQPQQFSVQDMCHLALGYPRLLQYPQPHQYKSHFTKGKRLPLSFFHRQRLLPIDPPGRLQGSLRVKHPQDPQQERKNQSCR